MSHRVFSFFLNRYQFFLTTNYGLFSLVSLNHIGFLSVIFYWCEEKVPVTKLKVTHFITSGSWHHRSVSPTSSFCVTLSSPSTFNSPIFFPTLPGQACSPFLVPPHQASQVLMLSFALWGLCVPPMAYPVCSNLLPHHLLCKPEICHGMLLLAKGCEAHRSPCTSPWEKVRLTFSIVCLLLKLLVSPLLCEYWRR